MPTKLKGVYLRKRANIFRLGSLIYVRAGTPLRDVVKMVYKKYGADYDSIENFHDFESAGDFLVEI